MNENIGTSHGTGHEHDPESNRDMEDGVTGHAPGSSNQEKDMDLEGYELIARSGRAIQQHAARILGVTEVALSQTPEADRKRRSRKNGKKAGKTELNVGQVPETVVSPFRELAECARSTSPDQVSLFTADVEALVSLIKQGKLGAVAGRGETMQAAGDATMAELESAKASIREMSEEMVSLRAVHQSQQDAHQVDLDKERDQLEKANAAIEALSNEKVRLEQEAARARPRLEKLKELENGANVAAAIRGASGTWGFVARGALYIAAQAAKWAPPPPGRKPMPTAATPKAGQVVAASKAAARPAASFKPNTNVVGGGAQVPSAARSPRP